MTHGEKYGKVMDQLIEMGMDAKTPNAPIAAFKAWVEGGGSEEANAGRWTAALVSVIIANYAVNPQEFENNLLPINKTLATILLLKAGEEIHGEQKEEASV